MAQLSTVALVASAVSGGASIIGANASKHAADAQANELRAQAGENIAQSMQLAQQKTEEADLLASEVKAKAGITGTAGGNVTTTLSDIKARGTYNALSALYSGQSLAEQQREKARQLQRNARAERDAAVVKAIASTTASGVSLYEKYGGENEFAANLPKKK